MRTQKRNKTERAFFQGFKSGSRGHEMEYCPYTHNNLEARGSWLGGWREGRSNYLMGYLVNPPSKIASNL